MKGLIKKDLYMMKNNYKSLLIAFLIFVFYTIYFSMDMSFFLPLMGLMSSISTINYDDFNNFHAYAISLPTGKNGIIKAKYISSLLITLALSMISILLSLIISTFKNNYVLSDSIQTIIGAIFAMIIVISIIFPILFKYGAEKGRIAMMIIGLSIFALIYLLSNIINIKISKTFINTLDTYFPLIIFILSIIFILVSYKISKKIYLKKEF